MRRLIRWAQDCAQSDNSVMIYGESGTGKELFAQSIHNASARRDCPFVAVNCAALTESLLESELFGYEAGAFTGARKDGRPGLFELAHRGTLFLDEINSMSLSTQAKILRVIEQKEVMRLGSDYVIPLDVRIITAANENLVEMVHRNTFRRDLFFRLNVLEVRIPPLDQRPRDILHLFRHYLARFRGLPEDAVTLSPPLEQALLAHRWWGNVRELRNVAQRYAVRGDGTDTLEVLFPEGSGTAEDPVVGDDLRVDLKALNRTVEGLVIQSLLDRGLTKAQTAKATETAAAAPQTPSGRRYVRRQPWRDVWRRLLRGRLRRFPGLFRRGLLRRSQRRPQRRFRRRFIPGRRPERRRLPGRTPVKSI